MNKEVYNTLIPSCFVHCNKSLLIKSSRKKIFHWGTWPAAVPVKRRKITLKI